MKSQSLKGERWYTCKACALQPSTLHDFIKHIKKKHFIPKEKQNTRYADVQKNSEGMCLDTQSEHNPTSFRGLSSRNDDQSLAFLAPTFSGDDKMNRTEAYHGSEHLHFRKNMTCNAGYAKLDATVREQSLPLSRKNNIESKSLHYDHRTFVDERESQMQIYENKQGANGRDETSSISIRENKKKNIVHSPSSRQHFIQENSNDLSKTEGGHQCSNNPSCANKLITDPCTMIHQKPSYDGNGMFPSPHLLSNPWQDSYKERKNTAFVRLNNGDNELHYSTEHFQDLQSLLASDLVTMPDHNVLQNINCDKQKWEKIQRILHQSFSIFPYLSEQEGMELRFKTGLTVKQIKILFAVARLQHGISWEEDEIRNARKLIFKSES